MMRADVGYNHAGCAYKSENRQQQTVPNIYFRFVLSTRSLALTLFRIIIVQNLHTSVEGWMGKRRARDVNHIQIKSRS